jgi:hypothetical protein
VQAAAGAVLVEREKIDVTWSRGRECGLQLELDLEDVCFQFFVIFY